MKLMIYSLMALVGLITVEPAESAVVALSPNGAYVTKATLASALTDADTRNKHIIVTTPGLSVTTALVVSGGRTFDCKSGGWLAVTGGGSISFGPGSVPAIYPEWFGPLTGDNSAILSPAISAAIASGIPLSLNNDYNAVALITKTLATGQKLTILGNGHTIATTSADAGAFYTPFLSITGQGDGTNPVTLRDLKITSPLWSNLTLGGTVIGTRGNLFGLGLQKVNDVVMENVTIKGFPAVNTWLNLVTTASIRNCTNSQSLFAGIFIQSSSDVTAQGGTVSQNGGNNGGVVEGYGISFASYVTGSTHNLRGKVIGITALNNIGKGIDAHDCLSFQAIGNYIKGFAYNGVYAVNQGTNNQVDNITITENIIDGSGAVSAGVVSAMQGIQAGSLGTTATSSGNIIISKNNIINTYNSANPTLSNLGIQVTNATTGGLSPNSVMVTENVLTNPGSATGFGIVASTVSIASSGVAIPNVDVSHNTIYQTVGAMLQSILIGPATVSTVNNNRINVTSGTVTTGIYPTSTNVSTVSNNILSGTFSTPITIFGVANQNGYGNMINGLPYRNVYNNGMSEDVGAAIPIAAEGYFYQGSHRKNSSSTVGQPKGWFCAVSGTPGTWVSEGNL